MTNSEIKSLLISELNLQEVYVSGENNHFEIIAVDEKFKNLTSLEKQQIIYKPLVSFILNKKIHAVSIRTYTPSEWVKYCEINR
ncbi:BolA family protein [Candidatus Ishikawella capsulata]|uniref:Predicted DNA-binding transcriptional regulator n=1 Tax=Candidatus Ishikawaella capsulata Mpkobe TaxID=476281 RepID=C5WCG4_9ENTR|nr:BolA family protein [Candidatus Ishikawaella capsulata]BAH83020.1 predicted DNA-binding transcriptional regulator [Candidatus Ishikawaella capsulata Mpkobe]